MSEDVPSPIDFRSEADAIAWAGSANLKRPYRQEVFDTLSSVLAAEKKTPLRVLELGSGPGYLAQALLGDSESMRLVLVDFSPAMHKLARTRLSQFLSRVEFVERDFKSPDWQAGLGLFDAVVTNQAVHELRHKRHATRLHRQVANVLKKSGLYLVSDHFFGEGGLSDADLFMTISEQRAALVAAGFDAELLTEMGSLAVHKARLTTV